MASTSGTAAAAPAQEYKVRVSKPAANKRFSIMKFNANMKLDLAKDGPILMERENNLKQYKNAYDVDIMPKFGAGSEFGREQKDEARRKKYGIIAKRYDPNAQSWLMKAGKEKFWNFKGTREGSVSENTSYYIFTQCADGAFEAYPIEDWYTFNPVINYKFLNSDEAEILFEKREKTFNFFNVMLKKRLRNEEEDSLDAEEGETKVKGKGKAKKDLMLTELEDWSDEEAEMDESDSDDDGEKKAKKAKDDKKKKKNSFRRKNSKRNDLDEAIEESDEGDYDDKEVDYITDNSSESETEKKKNYEDGGVEDEDGLRKINESGGESEEEEQKKEEENAEKKEETKKGSDSESSGPSSGSDDSDPEEASEFTSALFMTNKKEKKSGSKENSASNSRSSTPVNSESNEKLSKKRKATDSPVVPAKRPAISPTPATSSTPEPKAPSSPSGRRGGAPGASFTTAIYGRQHQIICSLQATWLSQSCYNAQYAWIPTPGLKCCHASTHTVTVASCVLNVTKFMTFRKTGWPLKDNLIVNNLLSLSIHEDGTKCSDCSEGPVVSVCAHCDSQVCTPCLVQHSELSTELRTTLHEVEEHLLSEESRHRLAEKKYMLQESMDVLKNEMGRMKEVFDDAMLSLVKRRNQMESFVEVGLRIYEDLLNASGGSLASKSYLSTLSDKLAECRTTESLRRLKENVSDLKTTTRLIRTRDDTSGSSVRRER